nr:MAG TPA: hypothetical protein [Caudoviricetes sp.]
MLEGQTGSNSTTPYRPLWWSLGSRRTSSI